MIHSHSLVWTIRRVKFGSLSLHGSAWWPCWGPFSACEIYRLLDPWLGPWWGCTGVVNGTLQRKTDIVAGLKERFERVGEGRVIADLVWKLGCGRPLFCMSTSPYRWWWWRGSSLMEPNIFFGGGRQLKDGQCQQCHDTRLLQCISLLSLWEHTGLLTQR